MWWNFIGRTHEEIEEFRPGLERRSEQPRPRSRPATDDS